MFPGPSEPNKEQAEMSEDGINQAASPNESSYPPADSTYPPQAYQPAEPPQNPYASPQPNPYASPQPNPYASQQPPANPYSTPLGGAPSSQQPNPYGQQQPNPYAQQPGQYGQTPNPYAQQQPGQYNNTPYPPPANQPWAGQQNYGGPPYGGFAVPIDANRILIYGILSFICFGIILGPVAIVQATQGINAIDAGQADPTDRGKLIAARVCGIIGTLIWLGRIVFFVIGLFASAHGAS